MHTSYWQDFSIVHILKFGTTVLHVAFLDGMSILKSVTGQPVLQRTSHFARMRYIWPKIVVLENRSGSRK